ncbi:MAG TPA: hypothetical protein VG387_08715 [Rhizomicrobium sp.]|jgi:hypothetical protein|nr:hypothetical protein [Rhizomicrobium sp.]
MPQYLTLYAPGVPANGPPSADAEQLTRDFLAVAGDGVSAVHPLMG